MDKVLIIDDELSVRQSIRSFLVDNGFDVVDAENGEVGIDKVIEFDPVIIILDIEMPVMNGFDFLNIIRRDTTLNRRYIIAMGGELARADRTFTIEIGADEYLEKPINFDALLESINTGFTQINAHLTTDIDPLTKLYTRRYFRNHIHREIARCKRYDTLISAILISVDKYDQLIDDHSEDTINSLIVEIASIIQNHTRKTDIDIYWGDDEFLILSTETGDQGAIKLAEKIRSLIEKHPFPDVGKITASFGISASAQSETKLVEEAYQALKIAKRSHGNKVVDSKKRSSR